jgi:hypothetical protein
MIGLKEMGFENKMRVCKETGAKMATVGVWC